MGGMHTIEKLSVQINGSIDNELQRKLNEILTSVIEKYFDKYDLKNKSVLIDKIHYDLGTIKLNNLEEEITVRLSYLLDTELKKFFAQPDIDQRLEEKVIFTDADAFTIYLQNAYSKLEQKSLDTLFDHLLQTNISLLHHILSQSAQSDNVRYRLFHQVDYENLESYWSKVYSKKFQIVKAIYQRILTDAGLRASDQKEADTLGGILRKLTFQFMIEEVNYEDVGLAFVELLKEHVEKFKIHEHVFKKTAFQYLASLTETVVERSAIDSQKPASHTKSSILIVEYIITGKFKAKENLNLVLEAANRIKENEIKDIFTQIIENNKLQQPQFARLFQVFSTKKIEYLLNLLTRIGKGNLASKASEIEYLRVVFRELFVEDIYVTNSTALAEFIFSTSGSGQLSNLINTYVESFSAKQRLKEAEILNLLSSRADTSYHKFSKTLSKAVDELLDEKTPSAAPKRNLTKDPMTSFMFYLKTGVWLSKGVTPHEVLLKLLKNSPEHLRMELSRNLSQETVWLRLAYQIPIETVQVVFELVFKEDAHLKLLLNKLAALKSVEMKELIFRKVFEAFIISKNLIKEEKEVVFESVFEKILSDLSIGIHIPAKLKDLESSEDLELTLNQYLLNEEGKLILEADKASLILKSISVQPHYLTSYIANENISIAQWKRFLNAFKKKELVSLLKIILRITPSKRTLIFSISKAFHDGYFNTLLDKSKLVELEILIIKQQHKIEAFMLNAIDQKKNSKSAASEKVLEYFTSTQRFSFDSVVKEITISKIELSKAIQEIEIYLKSFKKIELSFTINDRDELLLAVLPFSNSASELVNRFKSQLLVQYPQYKDSLKSLVSDLPFKINKSQNFSSLVQELIEFRASSVEPYFLSFEAFERFFLQTLQKSEELWIVLRKSEPRMLVNFLRKLNAKTIEYLTSYIKEKYALSNFQEIYEQTLSANTVFKKELQFFTIAYGITHSSFNDVDFQRFLSNLNPSLKISEHLDLIITESSSSKVVSDLYVESFLHYLKFEKHIFFPLEQDGITKALLKIITYRPDELLRQFSFTTSIRQVFQRLFRQIEDNQLLNVFTRLFPFDRNKVEFVVNELKSVHNTSKETILSAWSELYILNTTIFTTEQIIEKLHLILSGNQPIIASISRTINKIGAESLDEIPQTLIRLGVYATESASFTISKLLDEIVESAKLPYWLNFNTSQEFSSFFSAIVKKSPKLTRKLLFDKLKSTKAASNLYNLVGNKVFKESIRIIEPRLHKEMVSFSKILATVHSTLGNSKALSEHFLIRYVTEYYLTQAASSEFIIAKILNDVPFTFGLSNADFQELLFNSDEKIIKNYLNIKYPEKLKLEIEASYNINLLLYLLTKNEVPWWVTNGTMPKAELQPKKLIKELTEELLAKNPSLLFTSIAKNPNNKQILKQIFTTLSNQQFDKLLLFINPDFGGFIVSFNLLVIRSSFKYHKPDWFLFLFQFASKMTSSSVKTFIKDAIVSFSKLSGKDSNKLQNQLLSIAKEAIKNGEMRFLPFMELLNEAVADIETQSSEKVELDISQQIELLVHLLTENEIPDWAVQASLIDGKQSKKLIQDLSKEVLKNNPTLLISSILKKPNSKQLVEQLFKGISTLELEKLILALNPDFGGFIVSFNILLLRSKILSRKLDWIYFLLRLASDKKSFSTKKFIENSLSLLAKMTGKELNKLRDQLLTHAKKGVKNEEMRFLPFIELLGDPIKEIEIEEIENQQVKSQELTLEKEIDAFGFIDSVDYYIRTGALPLYSSPIINDYNSLIHLIERQLQFGHNELKLAVTKALTEEKVRARLIKNENELFLNLIAKILFGYESEKARFEKEKVTRLLSKKWSGISKETLNEIYYQSVFEHVLENQTVSLNSVVLIASFVQKSEQLLKRKAEFTSSEMEEYGFDDAFVKELSKDDEQKVEEKPKKEVKFDLLPLQQQEDPILDQRVLVNNAGLVITWPYLTRYFELLEMVEGGKFKTEENAIRAVHLLQFIATGSTLAPEHELLLNKVLCGLKIATPVPREIILTEKEISTSEMMMNGLIQNWSRLKGSSIEALRQGFLLRDGYILEKDKTWELKVEKKTLDILMENMPWAFGTIKLSWMEKRLNVEWT